MPVLCLRPFSKFSGYIKSSCPPLVVCILCGEARSQEFVRVRQAGFIKSKQVKISLCKDKALHLSGMQGKNDTMLEP